jgi:hypothetical protein
MKGELARAIRVVGRQQVRHAHVQFRIADQRAKSSASVMSIGWYLNRARVWPCRSKSRCHEQTGALSVTMERVSPGNMLRVDSTGLGSELSIVFFKFKLFMISELSESNNAKQNVLLVSRN